MEDTPSHRRAEPERRSALSEEEAAERARLAAARPVKALPGDPDPTPAETPAPAVSRGRGKRDDAAPSAPATSSLEG